MNQELGRKVAESVYEYHENFIDPRLTRLELPWWRRIFTKRPEPYKKADTGPSPEEMYRAIEEKEKTEEPDAKPEIPEH